MSPFYFIFSFHHASYCTAIGLHIAMGQAKLARSIGTYEHADCMFKKHTRIIVKKKEEEKRT